MKRTSVLLSSIFLTLTASAKNKTLSTFESEGMKIRTEQLADGLDVVWGFDFLPRNRMILSERDGQMKVLDLKTLKLQKVSGIPAVVEKGQGGLLDVVLHPQFEKNRWVYFSYSAEAEGGYTTRLARAKLDENRAVLTEMQVLFTAQPAFSTAHHFGSRIVLDGKGFLYLTVGDRGHREKAQDLATHNGKILRLNEDGSIPKDNPFKNKDGSPSAIWSYGHRNPQGLTMHPSTGEIWEQEHGPRGGDEINLIEKGANYGWPVITYGREYHGPKIGEGTEKKGLAQPVKHFTPSIAPSGLTFYTGDVFQKWQGDLFSGALVLMHLNRLRMDGRKAVQEERLLESLGERIRNVRQGPDGLLYLSTDSGKILRLVPAR